MPAAELAIWLVPGYLAMLLYPRLIRSEQNFEWFFQAASFGILSYAVSRTLAFAWRHTIGLLPARSSWLAEPAFAAWWSSHFPFPNSGLWTIAVIASPFVAAIAAVGSNLFAYAKRPLALLAESLLSRPYDIFLFRCSQLAKQLVIVGLESGKVYVGFLTDFTTNPDEPERYIEISPIMSGRRKSEDGLLEFNTPYITSSTKPTESELDDEVAKRHAILIPVKKITTFAPFDVELYEWSKQHGLVTVTFNVDEANE